MIKASPPRPPFVASYPLGEAESQLPFTAGWRGPVCIVPWVLVIYITADWNAKVGSQGIPGVTGKFGFGVKKETGQRLIEFCQENALVIANTLIQTRERKLIRKQTKRQNLRNQANTLFQQRKRRLYGHHQMVNTEIRLIILFTAKDGEALYSQQKQDQELTVAQIMNYLLPNSDLN